jgi:hypothetical protein
MTKLQLLMMIIMLIMMALVFSIRKAKLATRTIRRSVIVYVTGFYETHYEDVLRNLSLSLSLNVRSVFRNRPSNLWIRAKIVCSNRSSNMAPLSVQEVCCKTHNNMVVVIYKQRSEVHLCIWTNPDRRYIKES